MYRPQQFQPSAPQGIDPFSLVANSPIAGSIARTKLSCHPEQQGATYNPPRYRRPILTGQPGVRYQLVALAKFFLDLSSEGQEFELHTEYTQALDFDDIVASCKDLIPKEGDSREWRNNFFQMKYSNTGAVITLDELFYRPRDNKKNFYLPNYFLTFLRMRADQHYSDFSLDAFFICTNIDFDEDLRLHNIVLKDEGMDCISPDYISNNRSRLKSIMEEVFRNERKKPKQNPYSSIVATENKEGITIHYCEKNDRGERILREESIEKMMEKFFERLYFSTKLTVENLEEHIGQLLKNAVKSQDELISKFGTPKVIDRVHKWVCGLYKENEPLTHTDAHEFIKELEKDFSRLFQPSYGMLYIQPSPSSNALMFPPNYLVYLQPQPNIATPPTYLACLHPQLINSVLTLSYFMYVLQSQLNPSTSLTYALQLQPVYYYSVPMPPPESLTYVLQPQLYPSHVPMPPPTRLTYVFQPQPVSMPPSTSLTYVCQPQLVSMPPSTSLTYVCQPQPVSMPPSTFLTYVLQQPQQNMPPLGM